MTSNTKLWLLSAMLACLAFSMLVSNSFLYAQKYDALPEYDIMEESPGVGETYLVQMAGKVLNEEFTDAMASIRILPPNPESQHSAMVIIRGFPKANSRNSFYWHSDGSEMIVSPEEIICDIKRSYLRPPRLGYRCHFYYLSPVLIETPRGAMVTQREKENKETAIKTALPTIVYAQAGQLRIRMYSDMISGSIWMKGYDLIERSYVQYNAFFSGMTATRVNPKRQVREPQRSGGRFGSGHLQY